MEPNCPWTAIWYKCLSCQRCYMQPDKLIAHRNQTECGAEYPRILHQNKLIRSQQSAELQEKRKQLNLTIKMFEDKFNQQPTTSIHDFQLSSAANAKTVTDIKTEYPQPNSNSIDEDAKEVNRNKSIFVETLSSSTVISEPSELEQSKEITNSFFLPSENLLGNISKAGHSEEDQKVRSQTQELVNQSETINSNIENSVFDKSESIREKYVRNCKNPLARKIYTLKSRTILLPNTSKYKNNSCNRNNRKSITKSLNLIIQKFSKVVKRHKCFQCGKDFCRKNVLNSQMLIHDDLKPYKCETCGQNFRHLGNLKRHILIHKNVKPYKCDQCCLHFRQKSQLKGHQLRHNII